MPVINEMQQVMRMRLNCILNINGPNQYILTHHFVRSDGADAGADDLDDLIADYITAQRTFFLACFTPGLTLQTIVGTTVLDPDRVKVSVNQGQAGTRTLGGNQYLPPYVAVVTKWNTNLLSRRYIGKSYFSGAFELDQNAGLWLDAEDSFENLVYAYNESFIAQYGVGGSSAFRAVVLSDPDAVLPAASAAGKVTPTAATIFGWDFTTHICRTQKRRQIGRGA